MKARIFGAVLNDVELGSPKYGGFYAAYAATRRSTTSRARAPEAAVRVLQLGKYYEPYMGGIETHLSILCAGLRATEEVEVLVCNSGRRTQRDLVKGIQVTRAGTWARALSTDLCPSLVTELSRRRTTWCTCTRRTRWGCSPICLHASRAITGWSSPTTATSFGRRASGVCWGLSSRR